MADHDSVSNALDGNEKPVGSVFFVKGQLVLKPLPGYEHLFPSGFEASFQERPPSPSLSPSPVQAEFKSEGGAIFKINGGWTTVRKRALPKEMEAVQERSPKSQRQARDETKRHEKKMPVHEFRIGDVEGMKKFYYTRLGEVGINALRRIITEWVKVLEPTRLRSYGPYHKLRQYSWDFKIIDTENQSTRCGPPWWPNDVPYVEPAHLPSKCLESLGVAIMLLQFSNAEQAKEYHIGESLISKLHNAAKYFISTLPAQEYAMGHDAWNAVMKERALQTILPELLQVAQDYEEKLMQQCVGEGEREPSPALGKIFTYTELQKPVRKSWKKPKEGDKEAGKGKLRELESKEHEKKSLKESGSRLRDGSQKELREKEVQVKQKEIVVKHREPEAKQKEIEVKQEEVEAKQKEEVRQKLAVGSEVKLKTTKSKVEKVMAVNNLLNT